MNNTYPATDVEYGAICWVESTLTLLEVFFRHTYTYVYMKYSEKTEIQLMKL